MGGRPVRRQQKKSIISSLDSARLSGGWDRSAHMRHAAVLAESHAQLPGLCRMGGDGTAYVSDIRFDPHDGELIASCSTDGRIAVHELQQFVSAAPEAEAAAVEAAEAAAAVDEEEAGTEGRGRLPPAAAAAAAAAGSAKHAPSCDAIFTVATRRVARACRWSPHHQNELLCAFANSHELLVYDLGAARPQVPARVLRSGRGYQPTHGVADVALPPHSGYVAAAGRDGQLRVWDVRARTPLVAQSSASTGAWTMGVRAQVPRMTADCH